MAQAKATITVSVDPSTGDLAYKIAGDGLEVTPTKHRVKKKTLVDWICPDGALGIVFTTSPFTSNETALTALQGVSTGYRTTKNKKKTYKYSVAVSRPGDPSLHLEDPDLDVSDDGGGDKTAKPKRKKSAPKKRSKKRK